MKIGRGLFVLALILLILCPLLAPFTELADAAAWSWSTADGERLMRLCGNTLLLSAGTLMLAVPLGLGLSVLLFRTSFPGRRLFLLLLFLSLFVPLPMIVSSWQGTLGRNGWLPLGFWFGGDDRPWATGWIAALWIHALAAVPWVACIVGVGLIWVEPELEDEAAQIVGPWRVLFLVTLPRVRASILAAALFVALQTAGEISVTDMMLIPTLAEEVLTQFTLSEAALPRTLIIALPALLIVWAVVLAVLLQLEKSLPPLLPALGAPRPLNLATPWLRFAVATLSSVLLAAPLLSLVWKVGLAGYPPHWSADVAWHFLQAEALVKGGDLATTLGTALGTGCLVAGLAVMACWLARDRGWFRWLLFSILTWAWVLPGPVVGIGLHESIKSLVKLLPPGPWTTLLWHGPSPIPLIWAQTIRALPMAVVFLWPLVRLIPRELFEAARLEGDDARHEFLHVVWPMTWRGSVVTAFAAAALCLGEVAASTHVLTPGWESFTKLLFDRMHYGVDNNVAALCVLLLASLAPIGLLGSLGTKWLWK